jgi:hypothetical protein
MIRQAKILKPEKVLILAHHILKSNIELQAYYVSLATDDISLALGCTRNIFSPISKVSRMLPLSGANTNYVTDHMDHVLIPRKY